MKKEKRNRDWTKRRMEAVKVAEKRTEDIGPAIYTTGDKLARDGAIVGCQWPWQRTGERDTRPQGNKRWAQR